VVDALTDEATRATSTRNSRAASASGKVIAAPEPMICWVLNPAFSTENCGDRVIMSQNERPDLRYCSTGEPTDSR